MMSMMLLFAGISFAQTEFDFDANGATMFGLPGESSNESHDGDFTEAKSATIGDFTVTVSAANEGVSNANRIWNKAPKLRMYSGTLTVGSTGDHLTKIVFTLASQASSAKWGAANTASEGTIDAEVKTTVIWTGDASEVTFTIAANTQISKITINEAGGGEVTPPTPQIQQVSVAEALSIIDALPETGGKTDVEYQVKGFVVSVEEINTQYGNATFTMADTKGGSPVLTYFRGKGLNGAEITNTELLKVDDEVVVQGLLQKYVKNETVTPEVAQGGKIISINGKTEDETPVTVGKAANIAAFKTIEAGKAVELTLTNAVVTYVNEYSGSTELFVRDASGAADLYNLGINAKAGQVLNGTIIGTRGARSGFTIAMLKAANTDAATVSVSGSEGEAEAKEFSVDEAADYYCDYVVLKGVTISEEGKAVTEDGELSLYDRFQLKLISELQKDGTEYDIYGLMYDGGTQYGAELVVTKVTQAGGGVIVDDPATPVASIAALLGMENTNNIELTLTNAKVLFNDNNYIYVRENGKALCFYKIDGLKDVAKTNAVIDGKINVDYEVFKNLPEVKSNKNTNLNGLNINESEEEAQPVETTLAEVAAGNHVCDLVTLTATLIREVPNEGNTTYYLQDGDTKIVVVNNGKNLKALADNAVEQVTVTGIVNTNNDAYQLKLTKQAVDTAGINDLTIDRQGDSRIFNLVGQRVEKAQKGVNIVGGKKLLVK